MNDDRLDQYSTSATNNEKALELAKQNQQFQQDIAGLKNRQTELDDKHGKLGNELNSHPANTEKERGDFEKLREKYERAGQEADDNRADLKQKESDYKDFQQKHGFGQDVSNTPQAPSHVADKDKTPDHSQPEINERLQPDKDNIRDWNAGGEQQKSNAPQLDESRQKAITQAQEVGKELQEQTREQEPER